MCKAVSAVLDFVVHALVNVNPVDTGGSCSCGQCTQPVGTVARRAGLDKQVVYRCKRNIALWPGSRAVNHYPAVIPCIVGKENGKGLYGGRID